MLSRRTWSLSTAAPAPAIQIVSGRPHDTPIPSGQLTKPHPNIPILRVHHLNRPNNTSHTYIYYRHLGTFCFGQPPKDLGKSRRIIGHWRPCKTSARRPLRDIGVEECAGGECTPQNHKLGPPSVRELGVPSHPKERKFTSWPVALALRHGLDRARWDGDDWEGERGRYNGHMRMNLCCPATGRYHAGLVNLVGPRNTHL